MPSHNLRLNFMEDLISTLDLSIRVQRERIYLSCRDFIRQISKPLDGMHFSASGIKVDMDSLLPRCSYGYYKFLGRVVFSMKPIDSIRTRSHAQFQISDSRTTDLTTDVLHYMTESQ
jgi:hypothetical protein